MKISVITINRNNLSGLKTTLESVFAQTYPNFEYIVIDGASTDGSRELIEQHAERFAYWVSEPDGGIYAAMNKGIRIATGDYAIFMNSGDSFYAPDVLERAAIQLAGGKDFYIGHLHREEHTRKRLYTPKRVDARLLALSAMAHQSAFIRLELLHKRPYQEEYRLQADREQMFYELIVRNASYEQLDFIIARYEGGGASSLQQNAELWNEEAELILKTHLSPRLQEALCGKSTYETKILYAFTKDSPLERDWKLLRNTLKLIFHDLLRGFRS